MRKPACQGGTIRAGGCEEHPSAFSFYHSSRRYVAIFINRIKWLGELAILARSACGLPDGTARPALYQHGSPDFRGFWGLLAGRFFGETLIFLGLSVLKIPYYEHMENQDDGQAKRIRQLEDELKIADLRIKEMREERSEAFDLVTRMEERVKDSAALIDRWIEAFALEIGDDGSFKCQPPHVTDRYNDLVGQYNGLLKEHNELRQKWSNIVPQWNAIVAPKLRGQGRPLAASDAQVAKVLKLLKDGLSIRNIMIETNLGMQTVRTIIGRKTYSDRATLRHLEKIDHKPIRDMSGRSRKRTRDALLRSGISEALKESADLIKEAKGLGS
jgi:Helix-turn-helix domain of resolvase